MPPQLPLDRKVFSIDEIAKMVEEASKLPPTEYGEKWWDEAGNCYQWVNRAGSGWSLECIYYAPPAPKGWAASPAVIKAFKEIAAAQNLLLLELKYLE